MVGGLRCLVKASKAMRGRCGGDEASALAHGRATSPAARALDPHRGSWLSARRPESADELGRMLPSIAVASRLARFEAGGTIPARRRALRRKRWAHTKRMGLRLARADE